MLDVMWGPKDIMQRLMRLPKSWQVIRLIVGVTVLALCSLSALLAIGFFQATGQVDDQASAAERSRAAAYLENFARSTGEKVKIQSTWDDAFHATSGKVDTAWTDTLFGSFLWGSFEYDPLILTDANGQILRTWREGKPAALGETANAVERALPDLFARERNLGSAVAAKQFGAIRWPIDAQRRPVTRWSYAFIKDSGVPAVAVMVTILPDEDFAALRASPRRLIAVKRIDTAFLAAMGKATVSGAHRLERSGTIHPGRNAIAVRNPGGEVIATIGWPSPPLNQQLRERMSPLFVLFLGFWLLVAVGGGAIVTIIWRTSRELSISEAQAQYNALHDAMTGLPNRAKFLHDLQVRIDAITSGRDPTSLAVVYFDIDRFKTINDTMGHHVGDELVRQVAKRLRSTLPASDILARLGGDEFVLLRPAASSAADCDSIGRAIETILKPGFEIFGKLLHVSVSSGVCRAPRNGKDAGTILRNADIAMYEAKQAGRDCWRVFNEAMDASLRWQHEVETELRLAIATNALEIAYQPIVHSDNHKVSSFEALLRWNHPEKGVIGPGVFVPIAEQCGLMVSLGNWVMHRVFCDSRDWPGVDVAINLSPLQVTAQSFLVDLRGLLRETGADPARIVFEITEGILLDASGPVLGVLKEVKAMGFRIALDDFGTGYSSLSYLRSFDFDLIKVDRSFVQHIENDLNSQSILKAIVTLGHSLKLKIVAEGVETLLQRQLVQSAGCQLIQGHYHWPALELAEARVLVESELTVALAKPAVQAA